MPVETLIALVFSIVDIGASFRSVRSKGFQSICVVNAGKQMTPRALSLIVREAVHKCEADEQAAIIREGVSAAFMMVDGRRVKSPKP